MPKLDGVAKLAALFRVFGTVKEYARLRQALINRQQAVQTKMKSQQSTLKLQQLQWQLEDLQHAQQQLQGEMEEGLQSLAGPQKAQCKAKSKDVERPDSAGPDVADRKPTQAAGVGKLAAATDKVRQLEAENAQLRQTASKQSQALAQARRFIDNNCQRSSSKLKKSPESQGNGAQASPAQSTKAGGRKK